MAFSWTAKQLEAQRVLAGPATHVMLEGGSRCVAGDTVLDGHTSTIKELAAIGCPVMVITSRGKQLAQAPFLKGRCQLLRFEFESGRNIEVTPDHRFWNGQDWITADRFSVGDAVASRSSLTYLPPSNSAPSPSKYGASVLHSMRKLVGFLGDCFVYRHQYDPQLHRVRAFGQFCCASRSDEQAHIRLDQRRPFHALPKLESNTHARHPHQHAAAGIQSDPLLYRRSMMDDSSRFGQNAGFLSRVFERISARFLDRLKECRQFQARSYLAQSFARVVDSALFQCARILHVSYDTPSKYGYCYDNVLTVTVTAEKDYYTLHVPVTEQYFANGILHHNSGKTFLIVRSIVMRALKAPGSRHAIFRFRFNHAKQSIISDTFPAVMEKCFPEIDFHLDKTDWYYKLPNGSEIWIGGLDDKERVEKILGKEFVTIFLNECSQIPFASREIVITRLAQLVMQVLAGRDDKPLKPRIFYDWNPTNKAHWAYKIFKLLINPDDGKPLANPNDYAWFRINPGDNKANLNDAYLTTLQGMSAKMRKRFLLGEAADATPNALFNDIDIEKWRVTDEQLPEMVRVVVGVDPSGSDDTDNVDNDAIGIVCGGIGTDGNAYLFEDATVKAGPGTWGKVAVTSFDRHEADVIVGEQNYGGAMVKFVIQTARPRIPYKIVTATRGKHIRAEPFSALYEQGKVRHVGNFSKLEEELCCFSSAGYTGESSPNRADAWIWVLTELFAGIIKEKPMPPRGGQGERSGTTFMGQ